MNKIIELRQQAAAIFEEAQKLFPEKGAMSAEARTQYDKAMEEFKSIGETVARLEAAEKTESGLRSSQRPPNEPINHQEELTGKAAKRAAKLQDKRERAALDYFLRTGRNVAPEILHAGSENRLIPLPKELRDMGIGAPTASTATSVLVPQGFVYDLEVALKYFGGMLQAADYIDTASGQPLQYPTENDTAVSGEWIGEGQQVTDVDVTVSNITLSAWKASTKMVKVSLELLQDSAFSAEQIIKDAFVIRLGRLLNSAFTNGTGASQPTGIMGQAALGIAAAGSSGNTGGAETGGTSIGSDDLVGLEHSVDKLYRGPGAAYQMHDTTLAALRKIKDKYGRPLFPQLYDGSSNTINGYPIFVNNDMTPIPSVASAGNKTVLFGQFKKYKIRRVKDLAVVRLVERFADYGQVAFIGFARYDGNLIDAGTHPVKYLVQAAT